MITPQSPKPAPIAMTNVFKTSTPCVKIPFYYSSSLLKIHQI
ncbi:Hypothetical protein MCYN_0534 [Mycoplasmopsis cynos C142]|uniref:Uncharacterized protein n=1 Tax=Mycoplasmopsis cynos (strain C142) TaxID=1246955 RepID=L0RXE3_MYCC1|nr:Hypothetical protein MCYN_0534 [Mycoplasmopsis cynos C142]